MRWRPYRALTLAVLKTSWRNPAASFGLFAVLMLMLAGVRLLDAAKAPNPTVAVANESTTDASLKLLRELKGTPGFVVSEASATAARRSVDAGKADVAVVIPPEFGATDPAGRVQPGRAIIVYKAGGQGEQARALVSAAVDRVDRVMQGAPQALSASAEVQNAGLGLIDIFLPGLLAFNVVQSGLIAAAGAFASHRATGVLKRIQATGIAPSNLVLAHASAFFVLGAVQLALMLLAARLLFTVHLDLLAMFGVAMLGYLVFLAAGFAISGWVRDAQRAPVVATSVGMPMIMVGLLPPALFGAAAGVLAVLPISFVTHAIRALVEGGGLTAMRLDLLALAAWAVVMLAAAGRSFRWDA